MRTLLTLVLTVAVYFGCYLALYVSALKLLPLSGSAARRAVLIVLIVLAVSVFVSLAGARLIGGPVFDRLYWLSAAWLGLLVYLLIGFGLAWLAVLILRTAGLAAGGWMHLIGAVVVAASLAAVAVGVWRSGQPTVKEVAVEMEGLPEAWSGRTVVQLSDLHLGRIHRTAFARRVVDQVNRLEPDIVLITGDLFDGLGGDLDSFVEPLNGFRSKLGVLFVTGNHEHYLGLQPALDTLAKTGIQVIDGQVREIDGLQLVGLGFPGLVSRPVDPTVIARLPGYDPAKPSILLFHEPTSVSPDPDGAGSPRGQLYFSPDVDYTIQKDSGIDLQLSGHTHAGQFWPFTLVTRWVFRGHDYGLSRDGDFQLYVASGTGTWGPPLRLGTSDEISVIRLKPVR